MKPNQNWKLFHYKLSLSTDVEWKALNESSKFKETFKKLWENLKIEIYIETLKKKAFKAFQV